MKSFALGLAAAVLFCSSATAAEVTDDSFRDESGARVLQESVVVDAVARDVWAALTTDAGFMMWGAPWAHITPGNGGLIEFRFEKTGKAGDPTNIRHRILVWMPARLLILQNEFVPVGGPFDPPTFGSVRIIMTLDAGNNGTTTVTETVVGFGEGAKYDQLYAHLHDGNIEYLKALAASFHPAK